MTTPTHPAAAAASNGTEPTCHFKPMEYCGGEYGESWFECRYCGHTVGCTPPDSGERCCPARRPYEQN